ncbi:MAG: hypothetical protein LBI18_08005, partial [Planctomycetaceae bacterium]|nr:hypothetical protein [Planctomycetaceae bacterium]
EIFLKNPQFINNNRFLVHLFFSVCVAVRQLALVFGWQLDSKPLGNTNCHPKTGAELPCGNVMFRRNITHLIV